MSKQISARKLTTRTPPSRLSARDAGGLEAAWMHPGGDLPDINVWLALVVKEHPHHAHAKQYWESVALDTRQASYGQSPKIWFCRTTMLGLIRLLTQPKVMGSAALTLSQAWKVYRRFRALPMIDLLVDGSHCEAPLEGYVTSQLSLAPRLWTDAYLAALAHSSDCRLVTFDKDFERFGLSQCLVLATSPGLR